MKFLKKKSFWVFLTLFVIVGWVVNFFWLQKLRLPITKERLATWVAVLGLVCFFTTIHLFFRWLRWHFLTRRLSFYLPTKESFLLYWGTIPTIVTPFKLGELFRGVLLSKRFPQAHRVIGWVWLFERMADALILLNCFFFFSSWKYFFLCLLLSLGIMSILGSFFLQDGSKKLSRVAFVFYYFFSSFWIWFLPAFCLWFGISFLSEGLPFGATTQSFVSSTLLGGLSLVPFDIGVGGSLLIRSLQQAHLEPSTAIIVTLLFRLGTLWFSFGMGCFLFWMYRDFFVQWWQGKASPTFHFDQIASEYKEQIPDYLQERLLERKINLMQKALAGTQTKETLQGLDIGCGQGAYSIQIQQMGYSMTGIDFSTGQIQSAVQNAKMKNLSLGFTQGSATQLPFEDNSFDFAYSINVFHHLPSLEAQKKAFQEVQRVLKPGGFFFLHEINTLNPVFRFYMSYVFPLINQIDEGTEHWIAPDRISELSEETLKIEKVEYFTFLPDFIPQPLFVLLHPLEKKMEQSRWSSWSAHYMGLMLKKEE